MAQVTLVIYQKAREYVPHVTRPLFLGNSLGALDFETKWNKIAWGIRKGFVAVRTKSFPCGIGAKVHVFGRGGCVMKNEWKGFHYAWTSTADCSMMVVLVRVLASAAFALSEHFLLLLEGRQ